MKIARETIIKKISGQKSLHFNPSDLLTIFDLAGLDDLAIQLRLELEDRSRGPELGLDGHLLRSGSSWSSGSLDVLERLSDMWHQKNDAEIEEREILNSCAKPSTTSQRKGGSL